MLVFGIIGNSCLVAEGSTYAFDSQFLAREGWRLFYFGF
jgi:hypothetical protein